jgi:flagellar basal-body rod protein FlgF
MDPLMISAASGMQARIQSLDMLANNIANTGTSGFKADSEYYNLYASPDALAAAADGTHPAATESPVIERQWTDFSQGTLIETGNSLDLAISGSGFFTVDGPSGPLYTRNGSFRLAQDGQIETRQGYPVRVKTPDGKPLKLDRAKPVQIGKNGAVRQEGVELGQIQLVAFNKPADLDKLGSTYFMMSDPHETKPASASQVEQGMLETSNVPVARAAVRLVSVMRQFEMLQKAISLGNDMDRQAIEEVAKVS